MKCIDLLIWLCSHTLLHELCHFFMARMFNKSINCIIILQGQFKKQLLLKTQKLTIVSTNSINFRGLTLVDNDFVSYTPIQLKIIALTPRIVQIIYYVVIEIGFSALLLSLFPIFQNNVVYFTIGNLIFLVFVIIFSLRKGTSQWNDINIYLNFKSFGI